MPKFIVLTKSVVEADSLQDAIPKLKRQKKCAVAAFSLDFHFVQISYELDDIMLGIADPHMLELVTALRKAVKDSERGVKTMFYVNRDDQFCRVSVTSKSEPETWVGELNNQIADRTHFTICTVYNGIVEGCDHVDVSAERLCNSHLRAWVAEARTDRERFFNERNAATAGK